MQRRTLISLAISFLIVSLVFLYFWKTIKGEYAVMVWFFVLFYSAILSAFSGLILLYLVHRTGKYWRSIPFLTSALVNLGVTLTMNSLFMHLSLSEVNTLDLLMTIPAFVLVWQIIVLWKYSNRERRALSIEGSKNKKAGIAPGFY